MEKLQQFILSTLDKDESISDTRRLALVADADIPPPSSAEGQQAIQGALSSLSSREMVTFETHEDVSYALKPEGEQIAREGSHEARVWAALPAKGKGTPLSAKEIIQVVGAESAKIGQGKAIKAKWIEKDGAGFVKATDKIQDTTQLDLQEIQSSGTVAAGEKVLSELKKRNLIVLRKSLWYTVHKGPQFSTSVQKPETDLTVDMLTSGAWKTSNFKKYNFEAEGAPTSSGALHPLLKVREEFRNIFLEMGFAEMPTSQYVESSFWNFDALFVPQQHPARESQDTFFISDPAAALPPPKAYYQSVATVHEKGGYGSLGYRAPWSTEESHKLVLRTHTTACSAQLLRKLATQPGGFKPAKLFSIDRVFRNEATDNTHLAEFHQVEGVIADHELTLPDLIGFLHTFFSKMGLKNLRFKPAYNPYTEPSMEIFAFHPALNKWVEIGNSGMFRPEMLEPMGFPKDVRVHGFGLSLERPTMIRYGISNIRTLVGHKVNVDWVENSAAVRF
ncbi:hypothetical protein SISNIDRAFT_472667 [Sistotremastrum niveocremeum HHB9708]|uniref:Probable phenylalanine--tRNA ligase alpha subunit n=2 Tax=Sistotremastraceae TaxID=3402574 RepID=A0A164ZIR6_9AGAM|nr:hypothetical protein SISNIDRAFT_472667 [Sistotremastrum niveocremeum HHB9708]KZT42874.1 hypothetical protein SISSUDRAFT_979181 [Sistotremastrum suecicum HHB10207 ss-3]